jgi:hypothetical protein
VQNQEPQKFPKYYGNQIKKDGQGGASSTHGTDKSNISTHFRRKNLKEEDPFEESGLNRGKILKHLLKDHNIYVTQIISFKSQIFV